jgi:glycosidase
MHRLARPCLALALGLPALAGCSPREAARPPERDCGVVVWDRPASPGAKLEVIGDFSGWASPGMPMLPGASGWRFAPLGLPPGEHGYLVVEDGAVRLDPLQPLSTFHAGREVSLADVADCSVPAFAVDRVDVDDAGRLSLDARFLAATGGPALDPASLDLRVEGGPRLAIDEADPSTGVVRASARGLAPGKHHVAIAGADGAGTLAEAARASAWAKPAQRAWGGGVLYQVMIDRFRGDGGAALAPPKSPASRAGGTLDGVRAEIDKGTFDALGVSALWLSPVYVNPTATRVGRDGHPSEAYHGYWPIDDRAVDARLGGEAALEAVVAAAHARGLQVLVDFVPNHVYEDHPRYRDHAKDGWFDTSKADACVCGAPGCDWGAHIETCWFAPYLPDVNWRNADAARTFTADALFWMDRFDLDGLRIDAVPMMPRAATRRIAHAVRARDARPSGPFLLGEIFTGPGPGGLDVIRRFLGAKAWDGLDSAFDFPLMWAIRGAIAGDAGFGGVEDALLDAEAKLAGSGSILARMLDNHDTTRLLSEIVGDAGRDPWSSPPSQPEEGPAFARLEAAIALLLTLPGVPILYYGDEVGLSGGSDPDSRRVMPAEASLSPARAHVLATARKLGTLRRCSRALGEGTRVPLFATASAYAFARDAGDGSPVITVLSRDAGDVSVPAAGLAPGLYVDALSGDKVPMERAGAVVPMVAHGARVLVREGGGCP